MIIGNSMTSIAYGAFASSTKLESITSLAAIAPEADPEAFATAAYLNTMLYVPIGSLASYQSATCWKNFLIEEVDVSGVEDVKADKEVVETARYALDGKTLQAPTKGMNIVKMNDGTTKKVLVK